MFKVVIASVFVFNILAGIGIGIAIKSGVGSFGACAIGITTAFIALAAATLAANIVDEVLP